MIKLYDQTCSCDAQRASVNQTVIQVHTLLFEVSLGNVMNPNKLEYSKYGGKYAIRIFLILSGFSTIFYYFKENSRLKVAQPSSNVIEEIKEPQSEQVQSNKTQNRRIFDTSGKLQRRFYPWNKKE